MDPAPLIAIVVALIAPLGAYLLAARQFSGKIKTSDASELWTESRSIREWSQARIRELHEREDELETRIANLEALNTTLKTELDSCHTTIEETRARVAELEAKIASLRARLERAHDQIKELGGEPRNGESE